jgi:hypothetical protein
LVVIVRELKRRYMPKKTYTLYELLHSGMHSTMMVVLSIGD